MTSKSRMYERIKDLEQTNKLLGDIIKELISRMPKVEHIHGKKLIKFTGNKK
jgi:hypothetical protein